VDLHAAARYDYAGGAGVDCMSPEALESAFAINHLLVQRLFAEATEIISEEFHLFDADDSLRTGLEKASHAPSFVLLEALLQSRHADEDEGQ